MIPRKQGTDGAPYGDTLIERVSVRLAFPIRHTLRDESAPVNLASTAGDTNERLGPGQHVGRSSSRNVKALRAWGTPAQGSRYRGCPGAR
jgi:hypothetical protein